MMRGSKHTIETRLRMREARIGIFAGENNPMYGKKHSPETRRKISEANKGHVVTPEVRQKISEAVRGGKNHNSILTEDVVRKIKTDLQKGAGSFDVALKYKVCWSTIRNIKCGASWGWVDAN